MSRPRVITGTDDRGRPKARWADPEPDTSRGYGFMEPAIAGSVERRKATPEELAAARAREDEPSHLTVDNSRSVPFGALSPAAGPVDAERMQASRQRGAERHVEVVSARAGAPYRPKPKPQPAIEEEPPVELGNMTVKLIPTLELPCGDCAHAVVCSIRPRIDNPERWSIPAFAYELEEGIKAKSTIALDCAYHLSATGVRLHQVIAQETRDLVDLPTATRVTDRMMAETTVEPTPIGGGPAKGKPGKKTGMLYPAQQRVLDAVLAHDADRKAAAKALATSDNYVDATLRAIGKKGLLPADLIPKLPAAFARYTGV